MPLTHNPSTVAGWAEATTRQNILMSHAFICVRNFRVLAFSRFELSKIAPEPPKTSQDGPRGLRQVPKTAQKAPNSAQELSRRPPREAREAEPELTERARPPKTSPDTASRAPTGFQEAPGAPEGPRKHPPEASRGSHRGSKHDKGHPRGPPRDTKQRTDHLPQNRPRTHKMASRHPW